MHVGQVGQLGSAAWWRPRRACEGERAWESEPRWGRGPRPN